MKKLNNHGFSIGQVLLLILVIGLIGGVGYFVYQRQNEPVITNFEECVAAGNPVMESYPEQCAADGETFTNSEQAIDRLENAQNTAFKEIPTALQNAIRATYAKIAPDCQTTDPSADGYYDEDTILQAYKKDNAATVGVGCSGSSVHLFVFVDGQWKDVDSTQMGFDCDIVDKYKVSASVVSTCLEGDGSSREVTYE